MYKVTSCTCVLVHLNYYFYLIYHTLFAGLGLELGLGIGLGLGLGLGIALGLGLTLGMGLCLGGGLVLAFWLGLGLGLWILLLVRFGVRGDLSLGVLIIALPMRIVIGGH